MINHSNDIPEPRTQLTKVFCSKIKCAQLCLRKYYWEHIRQLEPSKLNWAFCYGTVVHYAIELFTKGEDPSIVLEETEKLYKEYISWYYLSPSEKPTVDYHFVCIAGIVKGYMAHYHEDPDVFRVTGTEKSYAITLPESGIQLIGTIDLIAQDDLGNTFLMDHKIYKNLYFITENNLPQNKQVNAYMYMVDKAEKGTVKGMYYNMIQKPSIRQKKGGKTTEPESRADFLTRVVELYRKEPEKYLRRAPILFNEVHSNAAIKDIDEITKVLMDLHDRPDDVILDPKSWPRNEDACGKFGDDNVCPFWMLCRYHKDGFNPADLHGFMKSIPHERGEVTYVH